MRVQQQTKSNITLAVCLATTILFGFAAAPAVQAAISWDAGGGSQWWFDTDNWSEDDAMLTPPMQDGDNDPETDDLTVGDAVINFIPSSSPIGDFNDDGKVSAADYTVWRDHVGADYPGGFNLPNRDPGNTGNIGTNDYEDWDAHYGETGNWNQGEGVVYDPSSNDPNYDPGSTRFTAPYDEKTIWRLYMGRFTNGEGETGVAQLTIKGDLTFDNTAGDTRVQLGRSSGVANVASNALVVHESGTIINNTGDMDLGSSDSGLSQSYGNATWDYRGGTLEQGLTTTTRFRLSAGGSSSAGGVATLIMHNPDSPGHFRVREFFSASYPGGGTNNPDGVARGVAIVEFHYENGATRPVQVRDNLLIANGLNNPGSSQPTATRSSRLRLVLDEAPCDGGAGCVPDDIGLFDVDYDQDGTGITGASGGLANSLGVTFSNADAVNPLDPSAAYDEGDTVSAIFGGVQYNWMISYIGNILWDDVDLGDIASIQDNASCTDPNGNCMDVVLLGLGSVALGAGSGSSLASVPEPSSILLVFAAVIALLTAGRRR